MSKRTFLEIRRDILKVLADGELHSYGDIERKANTNWRTVRDHIKDFEILGIVSINGSKVEITKFGRGILEKLLK